MRINTPFSAEQAHSLAQSAKDFNMPGLAIAVIAPGKKALMLHGVTSIAGRAVNERSWFSIASVGKHFTATALLELAMRQRVDLSKPIGHYLTDVPRAWASRSILSLLRHSSGLAEYLSAAPEEPIPADRSSFMARYSSLSPAFNEGTGWMYTNTNYILLGMLIAQLHGSNYADALHNLFVQINCGGATVASPSWAREANENDLSAASIDLESAKREVIGDGDVCLTPNGALIWLEQLVDGGLLDSQHHSLMLTAGPIATGRPSRRARTSCSRPRTHRALRGCAHGSTRERHARRAPQGKSRRGSLRPFGAWDPRRWRRRRTCSRAAPARARSTRPRKSAQSCSGHARRPSKSPRPRHTRHRLGSVKLSRRRVKLSRGVTRTRGAHEYPIIVYAMQKIRCVVCELVKSNFPTRSQCT